MMRRTPLALTAAIATLSACSSAAAKAPVHAAASSTDAVAHHRAALPIPAGPGASLLAVSGQGRQSTKTFTVNRAWSVSWSYDCAGTGGLTNFQIYPTSSDPNVIVNTINALSTQGHGRTAYAPTGRFYLIVNTACSWSLRVSQ